MVCKWRTSHQETGAGILENPKHKQKEWRQPRFGRPFARSSWMVGRVHRTPKWLDCTRTHFSGLRFGTFYESVIKIKEAQYWNSFPCLRTKMTRTSRRRRTGEALPRAEKFGDLITPDHKVLNEGCEPETIIDMQSWCKTWPPNGFNFISAKQRLHMGRRSLSKFLEPSHRPKVVNIDNSMEFGKACEDLAWNHRTSTLHRCERNDIAEWAVRRVKDGTSAVLLQSGLDERW